MSYKIELATPGDIDELFRLSCRVHREPPYDTLIPASEQARFRAAFTAGSDFEERFKTKMAKFIEQGDHYVFVARDESIIMGYRMAEKRGHDVYLQGLFVDSAYRGRGIGRALFQSPLELVEPGGSAYLTVIANNKAARTLYESQGFVLTDEPKSDYYGAPQVGMQWRKSH